MQGMLVSNEEWSELQQAIDLDKRMASDYLLHYDEKLREYKERKKDALSVKRSEGGGHSSQPGAPTEQAAIASIAYDEKHDEYYWLKAVEFLQRSMGERKSMFLKCRREADRQLAKAKGHKPWVTLTQTLFTSAIEKRFFDNGNWISERTVRTYWQSMCSRVVDIHLRLIKK